MTKNQDVGYANLITLAKFYKDINRIVHDLRILHCENKKDIQVALDDTGGLSVLIKLIQKPKDFKGTPQEIKQKHMDDSHIILSIMIVSVIYAKGVLQNG